MSLKSRLCLVHDPPRPTGFTPGRFYSDRLSILFFSYTFELCSARLDSTLAFNIIIGCELHLTSVTPSYLHLIPSLQVDRWSQRLSTFFRPGATMSSPTEERKAFLAHEQRDRHADDTSPSDDTYVPERSPRDYLRVDTSHATEESEDERAMRTPSARREQATRLEDDLLLLQAERVASRSTQGEVGEGEHQSMSRVRSRREPVDEFDEATNPLHEKAAVYKPPEKPNTKLSAFVKKLHQSSFIVRYVTYISPVVLILLVPLLVGALKFPNTSVGGVKLMWFSIWLEIVWLTLWAGRVSFQCDRQLSEPG